MTVLDHLQQVLAKAHHTNADAGVAPVCVLWPDGERHWEAALPQLRDALPQLFTFGDYAPAERRGPAAWLRCVLAGTIEGAPTEVSPIFYLAGVTRQMLRGVDTCDALLKPLVELQFRGVYWSQESGKDWTPMALLRNKKVGLAAEVSRDEATKQALGDSLARLLEVETAEVAERRIDAAFLRKLLLGSDTVREILRWAEAGDGFEDTKCPEQWAALRAQVHAEYGLNTAAVGHLGLVEAIGRRQGKWAQVFERYAEAPQAYPGLVDQLRRVQVPKTIFWLTEAGNHDGWPQWNDESEAALCDKLKGLVSRPPADIRDELDELDEEHGMRRGLVWAQLGYAPLARVLEQLVLLGRLTAKPLAGATPEVLAKAYQTDGYLADDALVRVMACVTSADHREVVGQLARTLYEPWAQACAKTLQAQVIDTGAYPGPGAFPESTYAPGTCLFFVDGLRYDLGIRLREALANADFRVDAGTPVWSALPSVTATAKPAVSPVAHLVDAGAATESFEPRVRDSQRVLNSSRFKALVKKSGWQTLAGADTGDPSGLAWTETKEIDDAGHAGKASFAANLDALLAELVERVRDLVAAGWASVHVVTDHGWIYLPGGLPKEELDNLLAVSRWGRSATVKEGVDRDELLQVPWAWNPAVDFVVPHGINCFRGGQEYSHGGLSLQECLTLRLVVAGAPAAARTLSMRVTWLRQRCTVEVDGEASGLSLDIRRRPADAGSSVVLSPKPVTPDGTASVSAAKLDLDEAGVTLYAVLLDGGGAVRAQQVSNTPE